MSTKTAHTTDSPNPPTTAAPAPRRDSPTAQRADPPAPTIPGKTAKVGRTRLGSIWVSLIGMAAAFTALLVFILQNPARTDLHFLWLDGRVPLGVAMLFAAITGILLIAIPGTGRILQLRRRARHSGRTPS